MELGPSLKVSTTSASTLSYADRAKKAQNIRSPIANMVHAVSVSMSTSASSGSSSNTSSAGSIGGSSAVPSSSSTDFDAADVTAPTTSNSSVIVESDAEGLTPSDAALRRQEGLLKEKGKEGTVPKAAPVAVPNVWEVRKEQMAMAKARRAREEESGKHAQAPNENVSTLSSSTIPPPTSSITTTATMTNGPSSITITPSSSTSSSSASTAAPSTPNHRLEAESHGEDEDDDPFIVKYPPTNRRVNAWKRISPSVSAPPVSSSAAPVPTLPSSPKALAGQNAPDMGDPETWPEVGVTSLLNGQDSAKGKGKLNEEHDVSGEQKGENATQNTPKSGKIKSKTKWVPIPAEELQAAVDDATALVKRQRRNQTNATASRPEANSQAGHSRSHSQPQSRSRTHSRNSSHSHVQLPNGFSNGSGSGVSFAARNRGQMSGSSSAVQSATQSLAQSRVHSRAGSSQGSPRFPREVRLPPDVEEKTSVEVDSHALSTQSGSKGASGTLLVDAAPLPPVLPVQIQNQQYPPYNTHAGLQNYSPNGHYSHPSSPPPSVPNMPFAMPHPNNAHTSPPPPPPLNMGMGPSFSSLPYQSPYPLYSPSMYDYPPHPSMSPIQPNQMYWPGMGPSPGGSGHQTPLYGGLPGAGGGPFVMPQMAEYAPYAPVHQVYGQQPQNFGEMQMVQEYHPMASRREETVVIVEETTGGSVGQTRKVVFGDFNEDEDEGGLKNELSSPPPFSIGLGPGEAGPSRLASTQKCSVASSVKRRLPKRKASGVSMLNDDAEVVDLTGAPVEYENVEEDIFVDGKGKGKMKLQFGIFDEGREDERDGRDQDSNQYQNDNMPQPYGLPHPHHLSHLTPPHPTLPPAYVPVGGVHVPIPVQAPVPPIPLSPLTSLAPIHGSAYPHPIPPHPGLSHLGHFNPGPTTSPTSSGHNGTVYAGERDGSPDDQRTGRMRSQMAPGGEGSEWEVRDFGYGFGRDGKSGRFMDGENLQRGDRPTSPSRMGPNINNGVRPRRGSHSYNTYPGFGDRGERSERGFSPGYGRRGRGFSRGSRGFRGGFRGGYGYGYDRDKEFDSSPRGGFARGGRHGMRDVHQHQPQAPFMLTPPPQFQPLPMPGPQEGGLQTYIPLPTGFEGQFGYGQPQPTSPVLSRHSGPNTVPGVGAPVPAPISHIAFPLDPTAYYLLGQLEYYLSPQNMAQDLFLRKKMDSRGWVPIPLIASFKRVRQLTMDENFVRDVLSLSKVVEVTGDMVRMMGWEQFVLPDAEPSRVDLDSEPLSAISLAAPMMQGEDLRNTTQVSMNGHIERHNVVEQAIMKNKAGEGGTSHEAECEEVDEEEEEEEEEEVVFVMGGESGLWSPEQNS